MVQLAPRITADQNICHGQAVVAGTRVLVSVIVGEVASGASLDEVAYQYDIMRDDVRACLSYAATVVAGEQFRAVNALPVG